jgi:hypothetical protein
MCFVVKLHYQIRGHHDFICAKNMIRYHYAYMEQQFYVYIMSNKNNTVLYTGVTNDLRRRIYEHKEKIIEGFTKKYNITKLCTMKY